MSFKLVFIKKRDIKTDEMTNQVYTDRQGQKDKRDRQTDRWINIQDLLHTNSSPNILRNHSTCIPK